MTFWGIIDTIIVSYFVTRNLVMAASIGSIEVITKMILYYFHERAWNRLKFGTALSWLWNHSVGYRGSRLITNVRKEDISKSIPKN